MAVTTYYGTTVSVSSTTAFRCVIQTQIIAEDTSKGNHLQKRYYVQSIKASGTITSFMKTSWGSTGAVGTPGTYLDSGWVDAGWIAYNAELSLSANCYYTGSSGKQYKSSATGTYTSERTIVETYTVTYNANGGTGAPDAQTEDVGTSITISDAEPVRTGYAFQGWSTKSSGSAEYAAGDTYTGGTATLYAAWEANKYAVIYNANGGTGEPETQYKVYGQTLTISATIPTRTNYEFQGWSTTSSGSVEYAAGASYTKNIATTLYAVWKLKANAYGKSTTWAKGMMYGKKNGVWTKGEKTIGKTGGTWEDAGA